MQSCCMCNDVELHGGCWADKTVTTFVSFLPFLKASSIKGRKLSMALQQARQTAKIHSMLLTLEPTNQLWINFLRYRLKNWSLEQLHYKKNKLVPKTLPKDKNVSPLCNIDCMLMLTCLLTVNLTSWPCVTTLFLTFCLLLLQWSQTDSRLQVSSCCSGGISMFWKIMNPRVF